MKKKLFKTWPVFFFLLSNAPGVHFKLSEFVWSKIVEPATTFQNYHINTICSIISPFQFFWYFPFVYNSLRSSLECMILCDRKWPFSSCSIGRRYDSFRSLFLPVCQFTVSEELVKTILKLLHYPFTNNQAILFCSVSLILVCVTLRDHGIVWQSWKREERGECLNIKVPQVPQISNFERIYTVGFFKWWNTRS